MDIPKGATELWLTTVFPGSPDGTPGKVHKERIPMDADSERLVFVGIDPTGGTFSHHAIISVMGSDLPQPEKK